MRTILHAAVALLIAGPARGQVAVTELLNNPDGADVGREWVELFNYSRQPVSLDGWVLADEGIDAVPLPDATIPPGGFLVVVNGGFVLDAAAAKAVFETEWLGGAASARVVGVSGIALGNAADEVVLLDVTGAAVWSLAWADDETAALATHLTQTSDFSTDAYGSAEDPGVVRDGDDNGETGFPGYEQNDATADPWAGPSDVSQLETLYGEVFASVESPSVASPLAGGYQVLPPGDLDRDGAVTGADLDLLLAAWGPCPGPPDPCPADLDGDGGVGILDFLTLLALWPS